MQKSKGYLLGKLFAQLEREGAVHMRHDQMASMNPTQTIVPAFTRLAEMGKSDTISDILHNRSRFFVSCQSPCRFRWAHFSLERRKLL